jgi:hypothetical protein
LNIDSRSSEVRIATVLVFFGGVFQIYFGYQSYLLSIELPNSFLMIVSTFMLVLGALSFCASLTVWLLKPWAEKIVAGVGITICVSYILFGYYLMAIIPAIIYWISISQLRTSRVTEIPDWSEK